MRKGELQKEHNKELKEGLESYSKDGYHCTLTKYVSCKEVYVTFDDGEVKKTRFSRFKNSDFCKFSSNSSDSWADYRMNDVKKVPTELKIEDFMKSLGFEHQKYLQTHKYQMSLIYQDVPPFYLYDFINFNAKIIVEIDGRSHNNLNAQRIDRNKQLLAYLYGFVVFRFKNDYVNNYTDLFEKEMASILKGVVK